MPTATASEPPNFGGGVELESGVASSLTSADDPAVMSGRALTVARTSIVPPATTSPFRLLPSELPSPIRAFAMFVSTATAMPAAASNLNPLSLVGVPSCCSLSDAGPENLVLIQSHAELTPEASLSVIGPVMLSTVSSTRSPELSVATPACAEVPLLYDEIRNNFDASSAPCSCAAETMTLPSTLATPSRYALV